MSGSTGSEQPMVCMSRVWRCRGCSDEMASGQTEFPKPPGRPLRNHIPNCVGLKAAFDKINTQLSQANMRSVCASDLLKAFSAWPFDRAYAEESVAVPPSFDCREEGIFVCGCLVLEALPHQDCRLCKGCVPNKYRPMNRFKKGKSRCIYHGAQRINLLNQDLAVVGIGVQDVFEPPEDSIWKGFLPEPYRPPGGTMPPLSITQSLDACDPPHIATMPSVPVHQLMHDSGTLRQINSVPLGPNRGGGQRTLPSLPMPGARPLPRSPFVVQADSTQSALPALYTGGLPSLDSSQVQSLPDTSHFYNSASDVHKVTVTTNSSGHAMRFQSSNQSLIPPLLPSVPVVSSQTPLPADRYATAGTMNVRETSAWEAQMANQHQTGATPPGKAADLFPASYEEWGLGEDAKMDSRVMSGLSALLGPSFSAGSDVWKQQWQLAQEAGQQMLKEGDAQLMQQYLLQQQQNAQAQGQNVEANGSKHNSGSLPSVHDPLVSVAGAVPLPTGNFNRTSASFQGWSQEEQLKMMHNFYGKQEMQQQQPAVANTNTGEQPDLGKHGALEAGDASQPLRAEDAAELQKQWLDEMTLVSKRRGMQRISASRLDPKDVPHEALDGTGTAEVGAGIQKLPTDMVMTPGSSFNWGSFNKDNSMTGRAMSIDLESWLSTTLERNMSISDTGSPKTMSLKGAGTGSRSSYSNLSGRSLGPSISKGDRMSWNSSGKPWGPHSPPLEEDQGALASPSPDHPSHPRPPAHPPMSPQRADSLRRKAPFSQGKFQLRKLSWLKQQLTGNSGSLSSGSPYVFEAPVSPGAFGGTGTPLEDKVDHGEVNRWLDPEENTQQLPGSDLPGSKGMSSLEDRRKATMMAEELTAPVGGAVGRIDSNILMNYDLDKFVPHNGNSVSLGPLDPFPVAVDTGAPTTNAVHGVHGATPLQGT